MGLISMFNRIYQRAKNALHGVQALLIFIAAMITIAILKNSGPSDARITYFIALCILCVPFLVYQTVVPSIQRLRTLANAYAHAIIDILLTILWIPAFVGELMWTKGGTQAAKGFKSGDSVCQVFDYGSTERCRLGQVTEVFGIAICILFFLTFIFSIYAVFYYRRNGALPGTDSSNKVQGGKGDDLEFTGASPDAYDVLQAKQEMIQQQRQQEQRNSIENPPDNTNAPPSSLPIPVAEEAIANLPPLPHYSRAPHSPHRGSFEPVPTTDYSNLASNRPSYPHRPQYEDDHTGRISLYEAYQKESGDYNVPRPGPNQRRPAGPTVDIRGRNRPAQGRLGDNVMFPPGDYEAVRLQ